MLNNEALNTDSVDQTKRDELRALAIAALKVEIQNDPQARGYAGKTAAEIADLMNKDFTETKSVTKTVVTTPVKTFQQAFNEIWKDYIQLSASQLIKPDGTYLSTTTTVNTEINNVINVAKTHVVAEVIEQQNENNVVAILPPRIGEIFKAIPYTNNFVTADDITEAI